MRLRRVWSCAIVGGAALGALGSACSGAPPGEDIGSSAAAITATEAISRAQEWVTAKLLYCQSPNGQPDPDPSCPATCERESNAEWDPYRSDCSGFVSWAWGLPAPGRTTDEFAPAETDITEVIDGSDLQPGDALNIPADHIILFVSWITPGQSATFMEEPGCSADPDYAHEFTSDVTISGSQVTVAYEGMTFYAIRYTGLTGDGGAPPPAAVDSGADAGVPCTVSTTGDNGICMLTSQCASIAGGTSTPGYCPGPDDIQCCTLADGGTPGASEDAGASPVDAGEATMDTGAPPAEHDAGTPPTEDAGNGAPIGNPTGTAGSGTGTSGSTPRPGSGSGITNGHPATNPEPDVPISSSGGCRLGAGSPPTFDLGLPLAALALVLVRRRRRAPQPPDPALHF